MNKKIKDFLITTLGTIITAAGIYFFKFPNNFSTGGVSGISVVLSAVLPNISTGQLVVIINLSLLLLGFIFIGKDFGLKTVYCSSLLSFVIYLLEIICPLSEPLTQEPILELVFAILLPALGSAMLFNSDASTGGTDIIAMIIKKFSDVNISMGLFIADLIIVLLTLPVFGAETFLYSLLGFIAKVFLVDNILKSMNTSKYCTVITHPKYLEQITAYITDSIHKSATVSTSYSGAYNHEQKALLLVALNRKQAIQLRAFVKSLDPKSFIIINNTYNIYGKGFKEPV